MDGVLKEEGAGTGSTAVVDDGATVQCQLRSAANKDRLVEADGDSDDIASVIAAVSSGAANSRNERCNFIDIGDAAGNRQRCGGIGRRISGDHREAVAGLRCLVIEGNRLCDLTGGGIDAEVVRIGAGQRIDDAAVEVGIGIAGGNGINNGTGAVFSNRGTAGAGGDGWSNLINVIDDEGDVLAAAVAGHIGGDNRKEVAGLGLVVGVSGQRDSASACINGEEADIGRVGQRVSDTGVGISGGVVHHLISTTVLSNGGGDACAGEDRVCGVHRDHPRHGSRAGVTGGIALGGGDAVGALVIVQQHCRGPGSIAVDGGGANDGGAIEDGDG